MRKTKKFAAVMAVALGVGITPYANAVIELKHNATGDAMLFPVFNGYVENYFTISNNHNAWVQGHLRFRGAAWSGELRDMDIILSPGDVFVFRVADLNGDGMWEIDQSLDPNNFAYTGQLVTNPADVRGCTISSPSTPCMRPSEGLIPSPDHPVLKGVANIKESIEHHRHVGYVEFFGESVLDGMTHKIMNDLLTKSQTELSEDLRPHQDVFFGSRGTNAWRWSDADNLFANDRGLSDVPNVLSGTAFITLPGASVGVAYNAEVFTNFRTATVVGTDTVTPPSVVCGGGSSGNIYASGTHRIDNYNRNLASPVVTYYDGTGRVKFGGSGVVPFQYSNLNQLACDFMQNAEDRAVILHHDTAVNGLSPLSGDYVYEFPDVRPDEQRISFNNTWGPTLADGDDYDLFASPFNVYGGLNDLRVGWVASTDDWDADLAVVNSIAEVEEAIRVSGQKFFSYYFDEEPFDKSAGGGQASLTSFYFGYFPTKFYYGESSVYWAAVPLTRDQYMSLAIARLLSLAKPLGVEVWDRFENSGGISQSGCISPDPCTRIGALALSHELNFFGIKFLKQPFNSGAVNSYKVGRAVISLQGTNTPPGVDTWPGLFYTFEIDENSRLGHWRSMQRGK